MRRFYFSQLIFYSSSSFNSYLFNMRLVPFHYLPPVFFLEVELMQCKLWCLSLIFLLSNLGFCTACVVDCRARNIFEFMMKSWSLQYIKFGGFFFQTSNNIKWYSSLWWRPFLQSMLYTDFGSFISTWCNSIAAAIQNLWHGAKHSTSSAGH